MHPRRVRLLQGKVAELGKEISIHAPAKGATNNYFSRLPLVNISIHAPAKGATVILSRLMQARGNFNPRTREGCDINDSCEVISDTYFNPRTREGCDRVVIHQIKGKRYFNPRTREGCDQLQQQEANKSMQFQSTHPRRVRR